MLRQDVWKGLAIALALLVTATLILLGALEERSEWRWYQAVYGQWSTGGPGAPELQQIPLPALQRVDRCTSCHIGVVDPSMADAPLPLTAHSGLLAAHPPESYGCTICHAGEGRAVTIAESHGEIPGQHGRLLPSALVASRCTVCHGSDGLPPAQTAIVSEGIKLFNLYMCLRCHQIDGSGGSIGPDLSIVASERNWIQIYAHLLKPDALVPGSTMPDFGLLRAQATALTAFLLTRLDGREGVRAAGYLALDEPVAEGPAAAKPSPGSLVGPYDGRRLIEGLECLVCHQIALRGGGVGPALTHIALARSPEWLRELLRDPAAAFPDGQMPDYELSGAQVDALVAYMGTLR